MAFTGGNNAAPACHVCRGPGRCWWYGVWGWELRALIHRNAAFVLMPHVGMHLVFSIGSRKLRLHHPPHCSNSCVEEAECSTMIFGSLVMTLTGVILWAHNLVLAWLPMSFLQFAITVHFYEAVLVALAILVWHFYSVIFDPEVYLRDSA